MSSTLTRRELLQCVGAAGLVAAGCSDDPAPATDAAVGDLGADTGAVADAGFDAGKPTVDAGVDAGRDVPRGDAETRSGTVFLHGVASGDPLTDAVILWTRVTQPAGMTGDVMVTWEVSRTLIYQLRSGEKRLVTSRIAALPPPLRALRTNVLLQLLMRPRAS